MNETHDRVAGILLGIAAGDRIGGPLRMALRVAESLAARHGFDVDDIGARYLAWWRDDAFDTGPTTAGVLALVDGGLPFEDAAHRVDDEARGLTAGCNPAHRAAPIAMSASIPDAAVATSAIAEARRTHRHPLAGDAAAAVAVLCRALVRGRPWDEALVAAGAGRLPETRHALATDAALLSAGGFAPDALRAAVHFVGSSASFGDALARSIAFARPSNYSPVLVGSIGGARWGATAVAPSLVAHARPLRPRVDEAIRALVATWSPTAPGATADSR